MQKQDKPEKTGDSDTEQLKPGKVCIRQKFYRSCDAFGVKCRGKPLYPNFFHIFTWFHTKTSFFLQDIFMLTTFSSQSFSEIHFQLYSAVLQRLKG